MNFKNTNYRRWFLQGTVGILLLGSGLCMLLEAAFYKHTDPPLMNWVLAGTGSLIVFMSGLVMMVDSLRFRIKYDTENKEG